MWIWSINGPFIPHSLSLKVQRGLWTLWPAGRHAGPSSNRCFSTVSQRCDYIPERQSSIWCYDIISITRTADRHGHVVYSIIHRNQHTPSRWHRYSWMSLFWTIGFTLTRHASWWRIQKLEPVWYWFRGRDFLVMLDSHGSEKPEWAFQANPIITANSSQIHQIVPAPHPGKRRWRSI